MHLNEPYACEDFFPFQTKILFGTCWEAHAAAWSFCGVTTSAFEGIIYIVRIRNTILHSSSAN